MGVFHDSEEASKFISGMFQRGPDDPDFEEAARESGIVLLVRQANLDVILRVDAKIGYIVDGIGDVAVRCEQSRRVLYQTCNDLLSGYDDDWPAELREPYIGIAKTTVAANVTYMSRKAMSMVGGSSFRHGTIFERLYRDSATAMFQPLNADET
jgi:alkylation response protein AidB-like acyl-CoA dehydrogenase